MLRTGLGLRGGGCFPCASTDTLFPQDEEDDGDYVEEEEEDEEEEEEDGGLCFVYFTNNHKVLMELSQRFHCL